MFHMYPNIIETTELYYVIMKHDYYKEEYVSVMSWRAFPGM